MLRCHQCGETYLTRENVGRWRCRVHRADYVSGTTRYGCCGLDVVHSSALTAGDAAFRGCHLADHDMGGGDTNVLDVSLPLGLVAAYAPEAALVHGGARVFQQSVATVAAFRALPQLQGQAPAVVADIVRALRAKMFWDPNYYRWAAQHLARDDGNLLAFAASVQLTGLGRDVAVRAFRETDSLREVATMLERVVASAADTTALQPAFLKLMLDDPQFADRLPPTLVVWRVSPDFDPDVANALGL